MAVAWKRLRRVLFWGVVLVASVLAGALVFAYTYVTDSNTLKALIAERAPAFFPGSHLWMSSAQVRPLIGEMELHHVRLHQTIDGRLFETVHIAWVAIKQDLKALMQGRCEVREVILSQPKLTLTQRSDGTWNLQGLLADPWPGPPLTTEPAVKIRNGTIELRDADGRVTMLRDVELTAEPGKAPSELDFVGGAHGGPFDRLDLSGSINYETGRVTLSGGVLTRLALSETFSRCLPTGPRDEFRRLGLTGGELDVVLKRLVIDPGAPNPVGYEAVLTLRGATLNRPELPGPLSQVGATATIADGIVSGLRAEGRNGKTVLTVRGGLSAIDPERGPFDLNVEVTDLELDDRLRARTPPEYAFLWKEYNPSGWIDAAANLVRARPGAPVRFGLTVGCKDVAAEFHLFRYPLEHIRGSMIWQGSTMTVDLSTIVGGGLLTGKGTIENPGPDAVADVDFRAESMPVDETLLRALPDDVEPVVRAFHPTGSARGVAHLKRKPPPAPGAPDDVDIHIEADLNPGCSVRWDGMPLPVRNLTGHLDLRPNQWIFRGMRGTNDAGTATLTGDGTVTQVRPNVLAFEVDVTADHLPFDQQLRNALPPEWKASWDTLNPSGSSRVEARITAEAGEPPHHKMRIIPDPEETRIQLALTPVEGTPNAGRTLVLPPMEDITGIFDFDDGTVTMHDVKFNFREGPVTCPAGTVELHPSGEFDLRVSDLSVGKIRLDAELRKLMPEVMAQFAQRLDDGKTFYLRGDLGIRWSGRAGEPARVDWDRGTVVFQGNTIQAGLPLEDIQGELRDISGWSDGQSIAMKGVLDIDSVRLLGQQVTKLTSTIEMREQTSDLVMPDVRGKLLGGTFAGDLSVKLDATPTYHARLELDGADLAQIPGRHDLRGRLRGGLNFDGQGNDLRTLAGSGWAQVYEGDLGSLPRLLRWAKTARFTAPTKTAFDSAELRFDLANGEAIVDPLKLQGDALSLSGSGYVKLQGDQAVDLRLTPFPGRDERRIPVVSPAMREASGRLMAIHVTGPLSSPTIKPEALPDVLPRAVQRASGLLRRLGDGEGGPARP